MTIAAMDVAMLIGAFSMGSCRATRGPGAARLCPGCVRVSLVLGVAVLAVMHR